MKFIGIDYFFDLLCLTFGSHKLVIVEGNYLFLEEGIWKEIASIFNEKW